MSATENQPDSVAVRRLGCIAYEEAWALQRELVPLIAAGNAPETLLLLEHPHTYTIGRGGGYDHLLASPEEMHARGAIVLESDRGGDITYHGPGQVVGYPLLNLRRRGWDVHLYLRSLEEVIIRTLAGYGLQGEREAAYTGVWCRDAKVAAIGVKISRGVTMHGFALNVRPDLSYFEQIIPCGIHDREVTSLERLLGEAPPIDEVKRDLVRSFEAVFGTIVPNDTNVLHSS